jgi:hypothetical protein
MVGRCAMHPGLLWHLHAQENVLLTKGQGRLRAKLADMGLHAVRST